MGKYLTEFIGTFFLVATIGFTVMRRRRGPGAARDRRGADGDDLRRRPRLGRSLQSGGDARRVHPRALHATDVIPYWIAQILAGAAAAVVVLFMKGNPAVEMMVPDVTRALIAEFLYTFALCYVVLNVATAKGTTGNSFYGLAIGFTVLAGAYSVGAISGGAFNPAVAVGITIMGLSSVANIWIYLVANLAGAAVAAFTFRAINPEDR